uniref:RAB42, member RAS onco family n=1 Tax=Chinchilla lanigera TaxID=34839 RepID=A0A8C2VFC4_CHILA
MEARSRCYQFRVLLLGDAGVGKTALLRRYVAGTCITRSFYRNVAGVLLVYDVTNRRSFEHIQDWHAEVLATQGPRVIFLLVGHKSDLQSSRCVSLEEAEALAASLGSAFIETSARNDCNVELAFDTLTDAILQALQRGDIALEEDWGGVRLIHKAQVPRCPSRNPQQGGPCQC